MRYTIALLLTAMKQMAQGLLRRVFRVNTSRFNMEPIIPRLNKVGPPILNKYYCTEFNVDADIMKNK